MKRFLSLAVLALIANSDRSTSGVSAQVDFTQHGNYRPPYTDDDVNADDDIQEDGEREVDDRSLSGKCNGLALSEAKNLGPYQVGILKQLVNNLGPMGETEYQVISGISVSAINAHILSQHKIGEEKQAIQQMEDFWFTLADRNSDLIASWSWGMIYGFFYENSLYNAEPLYKFIEEFFGGKNLQRHINIGLANVLNGQFKSFKDQHSPEEFVKILQASIAIPGVFKSVEAFDSLWFTGSSIYEVDVIAPIQHCRALGYKDEDINIDVILSANPKLHHSLTTTYNSIGVLTRTLEVMDHFSTQFGLLRAKQSHPRVNYRHILGPTREMSNRIVPMQITRDEVSELIKLGEKDAKTYVSEYQKHS